MNQETKKEIAIAMSLTQLVNDYINNVRPDRDLGLKALNLHKKAVIDPLLIKSGDIVHVCTFGTHFNGKLNYNVTMARHQCHVAQHLTLVETELKRINILSKSFSDFEDCYDYFQAFVTNFKTVNPSVKLGPMAIYDFAVRFYYVISKCHPDKYVYFQRGAYMGITNLFKCMGLPKPPKARPLALSYTIEKAKLIAYPLISSLSALRSDEIEDFCCNHKHKLLTISLP